MLLCHFPFLTKPGDLIMTTQSRAPIVYDPTNAFLPNHGIDRQALNDLAPALERDREAMLADLDLLRSGKEIPKRKQPLDAGFIDLPDRLLDDHRANPASSEISRIQRTADALAADVDRFVVIGIGGSYMGTRSLFEACCHPYHNEMPRSERRNRPRLYFAGYNVDNDLTRGLLDLVANVSSVKDTAERWGVIVVSKSGSTLEPAVAFRQLFGELRKVTAGTNWARKLIVPITGEGSKLHQLAQEALDTETFFIPDDVGGRFSIFTACGLLPAAVLGIDIVALLEGASAMTRTFRTGAVESNPPLGYTAICHLFEEQRAATTRVLSFWKQGLEAIGFWYDQLLAESLGKEGKGATPITVVNTRDLHSRGQQHQEGRRDKLITNVIVQSPSREPIAIGSSDYNQDELNQMSGKTLPDLMKAAIDGTNRAYLEDERPTTDIRLSDTSEYSLGQLYQMLMLATSLEGYELGINPYGQPGVEAYKKHMNKELGR
jgi:glucose-6-phosphate isomerase